MLKSVILCNKNNNKGDNMEQLENKDAFRFDDRREYNDGPPMGTEERRVTYRRDNDLYRENMKTALDLSMEDTVTKEEVDKVLGPVLEKIKSGKYN